MFFYWSKSEKHVYGILVSEYTLNFPFIIQQVQIASLIAYVMTHFSSTTRIDLSFMPILQTQDKLHAKVERFIQILKDHDKLLSTLVNNIVSKKALLTLQPPHSLYKWLVAAWIKY